jgi:hypothetical protein
MLARVALIMSPKACGNIGMNRGSEDNGGNAQRVA